MGNSISLEDNENEDQSIQSNDVEMKSSVAINESGENSSNNDNDVPPIAVKKTKRVSSDSVKKRRSTSKNGNANGPLKKTKSVRRR
jgi:hypothetical protein